MQTIGVLQRCTAGRAHRALRRAPGRATSTTSPTSATTPPSRPTGRRSRDRSSLPSTPTSPTSPRWSRSCASSPSVWRRHWSSARVRGRTIAIKVRLDDFSTRSTRARAIAEPRTTPDDHRRRRAWRAACGERPAVERPVAPARRPPRELRGRGAAKPEEAPSRRHPGRRLMDRRGRARLPAANALQACRRKRRYRDRAGGRRRRLRRPHGGRRLDHRCEWPPRHLTSRAL